MPAYTVHAPPPQAGETASASASASRSCATASTSGPSCWRRCGCCATGCGWCCSAIVVVDALVGVRCTCSARRARAEFSVSSADRAAARLRGGDAAALDACARAAGRCSASSSATTAEAPSAASSTPGQVAACAAGAAARRAAIRDAGPARPADRLRRHRPVPGAGRRAVSVAIIDYGSGNLHSAAKAFERAARESGHDQPIVVTSDPDAGARAPTASCCRASAPSPIAGAASTRSPGMVEALERDACAASGRPFLGICVGMQLMAERGREYRGDAGARLDRRRGRPHRAGRSRPEDPAHGLEHAQRARRRTRCSTASRSGRDGLHAYFVHSYAARSRATAPIWSRRPTTAGRSPPSSAATTWPARSSTRRRASGSA